MAYVLYRFPKDLSRKNEWLKFINKPNWQPTARSVICSQHFLEECFDRSSSCSSVRLKSNAVPTLHVERLKYVSISSTYIYLEFNNDEVQCI